MLDQPFASLETYSYKSPKLEVRAIRSEDGYGLFAIGPIEQGEVLTVWSGLVVNHEALSRLPQPFRQHSVQVEEDLYQVSIRLDEPADFMNHSCDPNCGLCGQVAVVAMRDIAVGEEACFDYAMTDGSIYDEFECHCGAPNCRGRVTGDDWRRPELWERYAGYFSPYLQRRIDRLRAELDAVPAVQPGELWLEALPVLVPVPVHRPSRPTPKRIRMAGRLNGQKGIPRRRQLIGPTDQI